MPRAHRDRGSYGARLHSIAVAAREAPQGQCAASPPSGVGSAIPTRYSGIDSPQSTPGARPWPPTTSALSLSGVICVSAVRFLGHALERLSVVFYRH
jgi:hypothetical protein